jgi:malonate transporter
MHLISSLLSIFAIMALGALCHRKKLFDHAHAEGFEKFLFKIAIPCYLFNATLHHELSELVYLPYLYAYTLSFAVMVLATMVLFWRRHKAAALYMRSFVTSYSNIAIYTLPVVTFLFADPTAAVLSNLIQVLLVQTFFLTLLGLCAHSEKSIVARLKASLMNPMLIMSLLGLGLNYCGAMPPEPVIHAIRAMGGSASALSLFAFGLTLGSIEISRHLLHKEVLMMVGIKNFLYPLVAFCLGYYVFTLETYWLHSIVIAASAPTGFFTYVVAKQFQTEVALVKHVIAVSCLCSLLALMVIVSVLAV